LPVAGHPYDFVAITGGAEAWMRWGFPLLYGWKFGVDYALLSVLAQSLREVLEVAGLSGMAAIHIAWKIPLVAADVLSGILLYRLASRFAPERATLLAVLWLVSPVLLWVSAGHGQVEAIAIAATFGSLELALSRRMFWSGVLTGLGAGVEYFPLAVAAFIFVRLVAGGIERRAAASYLAGLAATLLLCFGPLVADPVAWSGLTGGLTTSAGLDTMSVSPTSVWAFLPLQWAPLWPLLFVLSGSLWVAALAAVKSTDARVGILSVSGLLVLVVILDKNSVPQFALIAAAGLWLLAVVIPVNPLLLIATPIAGLFTYFFYPFDANAYWYDAWWVTGAPPFHLPKSAALAEYLSSAFVIGIAVLFLYALLSGSLRSANWPDTLGLGRRLRGVLKTLSWAPAFAMAWALSLLLAIASLQPSLWQSVGSSGPKELVDFSWMVASRPGTAELTGNDQVRILYSSTLIAAVGRSSIKPTGGLDIGLSPLFQQQLADVARPAADWQSPSVRLPNWPELRSTTSSVWVELLLGSRDWLTPADVQLAGIRLVVGSLMFDARSANWAISGWARVEFKIPTSLVDPEGNIQFTVAPRSIVWNGSLAGPWVRITPAAGVLEVETDGNMVPLAYNVDNTGRGYALGLPARSNLTAQLIDPQFASAAIYGAILKWPDQPAPSPSGTILLVGALSGLATIAVTVWLARRLTRETGLSGRRMFPG